MVLSLTISFIDIGLENCQMNSLVYSFINSFILFARRKYIQFMNPMNPKSPPLRDLHSLLTFRVFKCPNFLRPQ